MPLRVGIPHQPYKFLVKALDGRIIAQDDRGRIRYSGKDAETVIQKALGALTTGRTWKETVALRGNFTIGATVKIPSYTILDLTGAFLKAKDGLNADIFTNDTWTAPGNSEISIFNGEFDLNAANQTERLSAIRWNRVVDSEIIGIRAKNAMGPGDTSAIHLWGYGLRNIIAFNKIYEAKYGICAEAGSLENTIVSNILRKCYRGIFLNSSYHNVVSENILDGESGDYYRGIWVYSYCTYNQIVKNNIRNFDGIDGYAILFSGTNPFYNIIEGNRLRDNTNHIVVPSGTHNIIRNNPPYNPVGYISPDPTWGTSPWTYTNEDNVAEDIYMKVATAGDVSAITKGGQNLPVPGTEPTFICHLEPDESIIITYTTAGTLKRFGW